MNQRANGQIQGSADRSPAGQVQRPALHIDAAAVVEQRRDRRGDRTAALGEGALIVHDRSDAGVGATAVDGNDAQAAVRRLVGERRATGDRQNAGTGIAHAGIRVGRVQTDLDAGPCCRAGPVQLQRTAAVEPKACTRERCATGYNRRPRPALRSAGERRRATGRRQYATAIELARRLRQRTRDYRAIEGRGPTGECQQSRTGTAIDRRRAPAECRVPLNVRGAVQRARATGKIDRAGGPR